jgi:hypothetical protein
MRSKHMELNDKKVMEFSERFFKLMGGHIRNVVNNVEIDVPTFVRQLDGFIYAYTGKEEVIADTPEIRNKKILSVSKMLEKISSMEIHDIVAEVSKNNNIPTEDVEVFKKIAKESDRDMMIANYMCHMTLLMVLQLNPKPLMKKERKKKDDIDTDTKE